jgi:hypothetical protein
MLSQDENAKWEFEGEEFPLNESLTLVTLRGDRSE